MVLADDGMSIDTRLLPFAISPHEECAVEEAVRLAETHGGEVTVVTVGPPEAEEQLRTALAVGVSHGLLVETDGSDIDAMSTARSIVSAVEHLEGGRPFDLILFGNESADAGGFQVGIRVAHALGRPVVSGIKGIEVEGNGVRLRRDTSDGTEIFALDMPAVVAVREGINLPRYPSLRGRLHSKKVEIQHLPVRQVDTGQRMVRMRVPADGTSECVVLGHGAAAAPDVVDLLERLSLVEP